MFPGMTDIEMRLWGQKANILKLKFNDLLFTESIRLYVIARNSPTCLSKMHTWRYKINAKLPLWRPIGTTPLRNTGEQGKALPLANLCIQLRQVIIFSARPHYSRGKTARYPLWPFTRRQRKNAPLGDRTSFGHPIAGNFNSLGTRTCKVYETPRKTVRLTVET